NPRGVEKVLLKFANQGAVEQRLPVQLQPGGEIDRTVLGIEPLTFGVTDAASQYCKVLQCAVLLSLGQRIEDKAAIAIMKGTASSGADATEADDNGQVRH